MTHASQGHIQYRLLGCAGLHIFCYTIIWALKILGVFLLFSRFSSSVFYSRNSSHFFSTCYTIVIYTKKTELLRSKHMEHNHHQRHFEMLFSSVVPRHILGAALVHL
jgi:hypothetical protein